MTLRRARVWLGGTWVVLGLLLGVVLFLQTVVFDLYGEQEKVVWDWFTAAVLPNGVLMLGVLASQAKAARSDVTANSVLFSLAMGTSVIYLLAIGIVIGLMGIRFSMHPYESSQLPLQFFQGFNALLIGAFFGAGQSDEASP